MKFKRTERIGAIVKILSELSRHMRLLMPESSLWFCVILQMTLRKIIQEQRNFVYG